MSERGKIRRSAIISTFGPGAVVDFRSAGGAVSAVVAGIDDWEGDYPGSFGTSNLRVQEPRLERALNVSYFVLPPVAAESKKEEKDPETKPIHAVRFPRYLQCPRCNRIAPQKKWGHDPGRNYRYCQRCTHENPVGRRSLSILSDLSWPARTAILTNSHGKTGLDTNQIVTIHGADSLNLSRDIRDFRV